MLWKNAKQGDTRNIVEQVFGLAMSGEKARQQIASHFADVKEKAPTQIPAELPSGNQQLTSPGAGNFADDERMAKAGRADFEAKQQPPKSREDRSPRFPHEQW
jgi:hypothetical protein